MQNDPFRTFTDRREATALFQLLRGRDPQQPWPLLPILTFIAPGGGGKSTLINYLRTQQCCLPDGRAAIPYVQVDFTQPDAPKTLLAILVTIRNLLQQHRDGQERYLTFPRFDLAASIILAVPADSNPLLLNPEEVRSSLTSGSHFIETLAASGDAIASIADLIPAPLDASAKVIRALLAGLKLATQIPVVKELLQRIESGPGWRWYQANTNDPGLRANAGIRNVLLRLQFLSTPGNPGRDYLVKDVLAAALLADLRAAMDSGQVWSKTSNVVLFFDGFEALLNDPAKSGIVLLERLALSQQRKRGEVDPVLIVVGSRQRLLEHAKDSQAPGVAPPAPVRNAQEAQIHAQAVYEDWQLQLPADKSILRLSDICLEVWLHGFELADTRDYLSRLSEVKQTQAFAQTEQIQAIYAATLGHPFSLALIAAALLEARARGGNSGIDNIWEVLVSPEVAPGYEDETIGDYLLSLFLRQLPRDAQNELIFCAAPRELDAATLRVVLQLPSDIQARERIHSYRQLTFMRTLNAEKIAFHPMVRNLLLQRLVPDPLSESDYYQIHNRLREHFRRRASMQSVSGQASPALVEMRNQARVEEAYHALALGDPEPAITLALTITNNDHDLWELLQEAVEQAPKGFVSADTKQQAADAVKRGDQRGDITATILYAWMEGAALETVSM